MIEVSHLVKRHGSRTVVDDVSFTALPGRVTGCLGPNGAGKSSTLRVLLGLDRATSGTALIDGRPYRSLERPLWTVGAMLDGPGANTGRTAKAHLTWVAQSNAIPTRRVDEVLELTGLRDAAKMRIRGFSLGMGRRLGIATALLGDPDVLVLDEPTNGLDPDGIRWTRRFLRLLADDGKAVLVSSHLMSEMQDTADDVVIIARGRVLATGSTAEVIGTHRTLEDAFFELTDKHTDYRAGDVDGATA
ncbi:ATP-binding cassette domain-containing protein [Microbacterium sp. Kw_RZR3]|uniref:ABC transporter ATP-binding protein n=1 Tax=Microbacterium sp. Kw_RZR3 TaxID=3032903 RepID=UPI0023DA1125|nr:ATP-binding cassette domain-containing protein [Microbacterium sp. Kw_RZR3]MDF2047680.1 ATP-binding cassette domain-containing protein [Microbacterium sp. Kw_RZR3]